MSFNIIGDIAGQYKTLLALLDKMPEGTPVSVGDMVDRGPNSKEVLEFFKENGLAVMGNHDHMMLCEHKDNHYYDYGVWIWNGGGSTLRSFFPDADEANPQDLPKDLMDWVDNLPLYLELEENNAGVKAFVSHAVKNPTFTVEKACELGNNAMDRKGMHSIIWNRGKSRRMEGFYQIFGHNSHWGLEKQMDQKGEYGICIDTSRSKVLTGIHWPSGVIYQQEYID